MVQAMNACLRILATFDSKSFNDNFLFWNSLYFSLLCWNYHTRQ